MGFSDGRKTSGAFRASVLRSALITPHMVRVTFGSDELRHLPHRGFDQWFRLFLPRPDGITDFATVPEAFGIGGYVKYLTSKSGTRPPFRNYTVREFRPEQGELDVDFVSHGEDGIAGPWSRSAQPGETVVIIDQGRGFDPKDNTDFLLLAGDESALPAIAGILRDLPRTAQGLALLEVSDPVDKQELNYPDGFTVQWLPRSEEPAEHSESAQVRPGSVALRHVQDFAPTRPQTLHAYLVGEQNLATQGRRHLVAAGVPKNRIDFIGYWRIGRSG